MALGKTQDELLNNMSTDDLIEWAAYRRIKPFGYDVDNMRIGEICAMIINSAGKTFKKEVVWSDFFKPSYDVEKKEIKKTDPVASLLTVFSAMSKQQKKNLKEEKLLKEKQKQDFIKKKIDNAKRRKRK